jgi:hypothetical protein
MMDSREMNATTGVGEIVNRTMETTNVEVVMTTTQDADKNERDVKKEGRKPRKNYQNGGGGGDDSDPPSDDDSDQGKRNSRRDKKEDRKTKKKRPGGDDDGGGDDPSSNGESEDDVHLPIRRRKRRRSPRGAEPGDSETSCASNYRRKTECA